MLTRADPDLSDDRLKNLELRHRTKNMLAIVQSLVNQTLRGDVPLDQARDTLSERLMGMGKAVDLLLENDWEAARIDEIAARALVHRARFSQRLVVEGPQIQIGPGAAMSLSLALHELESNAIKHGAFSTANGSVRIAWAVGSTDPARWFRLEWREEGGTAVQPPTRQGFGTKLLSSAVARRVGGKADLDYKPQGLVWTLQASAAGMAS
jgi:two-component sensor histidine kinase